MFELTDRVLPRLCAINHFELPPQRHAFFGIRGAQPINTADFEFRDQQRLEPCAVNHLGLRCSIGQWDAQSKTVAVFPGSTSPNIAAVKASNANQMRANEVLPSRIKFVTGVHKTYRAFRQGMPFALQRVFQDPVDNILYDYDANDSVEIGAPGEVGDNLHAASIDTIADSASSRRTYSSLGCQVIIGFAPQPQGGQPQIGGLGGWRTFVSRAYATGQSDFPYFLLPGREAQEAALSPDNTIPARLRYGSSGELVSKVQQALLNLGPAFSFIGTADGDFGGNTLRGVIAFQRKQGLIPDAVVGFQTAELLGLTNWPRA